MPRRRHVKILLRAYGDTPTTDSIGNPTTPFIETEVYARKESITARDYFSSLSHDKKLDIKFVIRANEYSEQEEVEYDNKVYTVERTYEPSVDWLELYCEEKRTNGN